MDKEKRYSRRKSQTKPVSKLINPEYWEKDGYGEPVYNLVDAIEALVKQEEEIKEQEKRKADVREAKYGKFTSEEVGKKYLKQEEDIGKTAEEIKTSAEKFLKKIKTGEISNKEVEKFDNAKNLLIWVKEKLENPTFEIRDYVRKTISKYQRDNRKERHLLEDLRFDNQPYDVARLEFLEKDHITDEYFSLSEILKELSRSCAAERVFIGETEEEIKEKREIMEETTANQEKIKNRLERIKKIHKK